MNIPSPSSTLSLNNYKGKNYSPNSIYGGDMRTYASKKKINGKQLSKPHLGCSNPE